MTGKNRNDLFQRSLVILSVCLLNILLFSGCSEKKPQNQEKATPTPAQVQYNQEENTVSNLGKWTRAMGSVLFYLNDGDPYYFGGYPNTKDNQEGAANILAKSWNINSRIDLIAQIKLLLQQGDRKEYQKEAGEMNALQKKQLKTAMKQLSGDILRHYKLIQYNWKTWKKKGLLAWDMCRIAHLVQWGYVAGYLNAEEAQALIEPAAKRLRKKFKSWDEVQNNWLDGYCLYANIDRNASGSDYFNRKTVYEKLKKEQTEENLLYDDTLFSSDIIPINGISYQTILKEAAGKETKAKKDTEK